MCKDSISYLVSVDGRSWTETVFDPPAHRFEVEPQLAVDGDTVYLAYSRLAPSDGGCGDDGLRDVGVYVRSRHLPGGAWSKPHRVGREGDRLQTFRVVDGVFYLTITAADGESVLYESQSGGTVSRIRIPKAIGASVRVGDDGHARIAYSTGGSIRYARVNGGRLSIKTIAKSDKTSLVEPSLVLGAGDRAYVMWTQTTYPPGSGCAGPDPGPLDGTYVGTDASGHWVSKRITRSTGETAFTIDPSTGRLHALVDTDSMTYYTGTVGKHLTPKKLASTKNMGNAVIRMDPTGRLVVFAIRWEKGIYVISKP